MSIFFRVRNFILFILALCSVLRYGVRTKPPRAVRTILVIHLAKLGDMVCFTPALHAIRIHRPEVKVIVLGDAVNKELLQGSPDLDEYIVFDERRIFSIIQALRSRDIDVALVRGTGFVGLVMALLAGIPFILTTRLVKGKSFATKTYDWLLPFVSTVEASFGEYMPRQYLKLLEPLDIFESDTQKRLAVSEAASEKAQAFLREHGIESGDLVVGISPSAGNKIKEWPVERFARVADHLIEAYGAKVIIIGGPRDRTLVDNVLKNMKHTMVAIPALGFSIEELKGLISQLKAFISVDTGPIYIAEAFGVPTVDIVGPVDEREQPPRGPFNRVVVPDRKEAEVHILNARLYDETEALRQAQSIPAEDVIVETDILVRHILGEKAV